MVGGSRRNLKLRKRRVKKKKTPAAPPWINLPGDVTANILHRLGAVEILESAQKVCTTWRRVCQDPAMWRVIDMTNPGDLWAMPYSLEIMCRHAVDRSQGQLIDINIEYFGTDELMDYISRRSSHLRRLTLVDPISISGENLSGALKQFPELEELSLIYMDDALHQNMETIGKSCPRLKSFTYIGRACRHEPALLRRFGYDEFMVDEIEDNQYAAGVAKGMPNLRHLALIADDMKNEGLQAVLDGCPHLESLDIRQCFGVDLKGALGERCSKHVKHLRLPNEPTTDTGWLTGTARLEYYKPPNPDYGDYFGFYGEDYLESPDYYGGSFGYYGEDYPESPDYW